MSGGSYNYLYSRSAGDGLLDGLFAMGRQAVASARKVLAEYTPREGDARRGRPLSNDEKELAEAALAKLESLVSALEQVSAHMGDYSYKSRNRSLTHSLTPMRELLHSIEWVESGDSDQDDVVQRLIEAGAEDVMQKLSAATALSDVELLALYVQRFSASTAHRKE
jgi:hypothetical protein